VRNDQDVVSLTNPDGTPFAFKPGNTWFEVVGIKTIVKQSDQAGGSSIRCRNRFHKGDRTVALWYISRSIEEVIMKRIAVFTGGGDAPG